MTQQVATENVELHERAGVGAGKRGTKDGQSCSDGDGALKLPALLNSPALSLPDVWGGWL